MGILLGLLGLILLAFCVTLYIANQQMKKQAEDDERRARRREPTIGSID